MAHHHHPAPSRRPLAWALAIVLAFAGVEVAAGVVSGSLALLADAVHMLSDALALGLALGAAWLAARPATPQRSFGWRRAEVLAALANAVALVVLALWIFWEAAGRLSDPPDVEGAAVLLVGLLGVLVNLAAARVLWGPETLNVRAALRHVLADLLGSVGVVVGGALVLATGWNGADPLVGVAIGVLILWSSWSVLREATGVLLEETPAHIDAGDVGRALAAAHGVVGVHDLHIWTITSGFPALSAHVLVEPTADCHGIRRQLEAVLRTRFGLTHTTLQVEHAPGLITIDR